MIRLINSMSITSKMNSLNKNIKDDDAVGMDSLKYITGIIDFYWERFSGLKVKTTRNKVRSSNL